MLAAVIAVLAFLARPGNKAQASAQQTLRSLHEQGFKIDLGEFQLATSSELRARAAVLSAAGQAGWRILSRDNLPLMKPLGTNSALVIWDQEKLSTRFSEDLWTELRDTLNQNREKFDDACLAALSGPIRFEPVVQSDGNLLMPYLQHLRQLAPALQARTVLALHEGKRLYAWTNLLALTRLATAWKPEPVESSHMLRVTFSIMAQSPTWEALQARGLNDDQLATLQREWESVDFFPGLPETAAFERAAMLVNCRAQLQQPPSGGTPWRQIGADLLGSPQRAWAELTGVVREARYRNCGIFEEEKALMLHFQDRELEFKRAIACASWSEMRGLPGVTNQGRLKSNQEWRLQMRMNLSQMGFQGLARGLLARTAEAEARRRLVITAIALHRFCIRHGSFPESLGELCPGLLPVVPADFMDGKPLRYRPANDGQFILYSVGLDCIDQGGDMRKFRPQQEPGAPGFPGQREPDLVWPRAASAAEREIDRVAVEAARHQFEAAERAREVNVSKFGTRSRPEVPLEFNKRYNLQPSFQTNAP
jgi:hypothetical protein